MNFFQESYPETPSTHNSFFSNSSLAQTTPPLSSTPTSSSTLTPISVPPMRPRKILSTAAQEFVPTTPPGFKPQQGSFCQGNECGFAGGMNRQYCGYVGGCVPMPTTINCSLLNNATAHNQLLLRQQQILQEKHHLLQQDLAAATIAKQQFVLSAAAVANHPQDEISNSLKMFAVLSACTNGNETPPSSDDVMQEFASNGYSTDELNRFHQQQQQQQHQAASNMRIYGNSTAAAAINERYHNYYDSNRRNLTNSNMNWLYSQQQLLHENINAYNELWRQNFLSMLPAQLIRNAESAAANVDFNNQNARPHKRPQFKKDGQVAIRRCVFCENNNEPEAVVKSHAVRDAQGRVLCPKLRIYVCPICGASGDDAHTVKYCPQKPIITMEDAIKAESNRFAKPKTPQMPV